MRKITKRDMAILGGFLVVVVVVCALVIVRQVGGVGVGASSEGEQIILASRPEVDLSAELAPRRGLRRTGEIADPKLFQESPGSFIAAVGSLQASTGSAPAEAENSVPDGVSGNAPMGTGPGPIGEDPVSAMVQGPGEVSVYIAGLAGPTGDLSALVVHRDTGHTRWVAAGQHAFGYAVSMVTTKGVVLQKDGHQYVLELGEGRGKSEAAAQPSVSSAPPQTERPAQEADEEPPSAAQSDVDRIVGSWRASVGGMNINFSFRRGGSGSVTMSQMPQPMDFRWSIVSPGTLRMEVTFGGMTNADNASYRFENGGNTLVLSSGQMPGELRLTR